MRPDIPTVEIPVTELRIGMTIAEGKGTVVKTLTPCTQRDKVHVNEKDCYDYCGKVTVTVRGYNASRR